MQRDAVISERAPIERHDIYVSVTARGHANSLSGSSHMEVRMKMAHRVGLAVEEV